jgi:hypothetical protein
MVNNQIDDNRFSMPSNEAVELIECYFRDNLPVFQLIEKYNDPSGYYGLKYCNGNFIVFIGSGRGYLESYIDVKGDEIPMSKYDKNTKFIKSANEKNIKYLLNFFQSFFE